MNVAIETTHRHQLLDHLFVLGAWVVVCLVLFVNLGAAPLTDLDEGAFSEATREMMARGDFISPWLLDAPRFDKPVLIHWLQMAAFSVTGFTSYGARLPSALMGLVWVGGIAGWAYLIASRLVPNLRAQVYGWAVLIAGTCLGIPAMSRAATADATLNAFLVLTLFCLWRALWPSKETESGRLWMRLAAIFVGLGLLTKGPIAILVPVAASLIGAAACGSQVLKRWLRLASDPVAWGIALLIAAPWYLLQFQAQGMAFVQGFLGLHNLGRFTSTMHGFSAGPVYYPAWILIATLPWTIPTLMTFLEVWGTSERGRLLRSPELRMAWAVFVFVLVFFSFSATKLPHYGFYGLSGLVVLVSLWTAISLQGKGRLLRVGLLLSLLTASLTVALTPQWLPAVAVSVRDPYYAVVLSEAFAAMQGQQLIFGALGLLALGGFVLGLRMLRGGVLMLSLTATMGVYGLIVPSIMESLRNPIAGVAKVIRASSPVSESSNSDLTSKPRRIITWRLTAPSLSFAAQRVIPAGEPVGGDWVIMPAHLINDLPLTATSTVRVLYQRTGVTLLEIVDSSHPKTRHRNTGRTYE
jgi:4-amino-4-deoxy-L-arabinose transferase-like glycosyltransferase